MDVLVVGAGPVGLLLAAELGLAGASVAVVEELAEPNTAQKARGVGPLGAEALRRRGLGSRLDAHNRIGRLAYRQHNGADQGHFAWIHKLGADAMPEPGRPYALIWQSELERLLAEHATAHGVTVYLEHTLTGLQQYDDHVVAEVDTPTGRRRFAASYLVGCDGAHSVVRKLTGFEFAGTDPVTISRVARIQLSAPDALPASARYPRGLLQHGGTINDWARVRTTEFGAQLDPYLGSHGERAPVTVEEMRAAIHRITGEEIDISAISDARRTLDHARQATTYRIGRVLLAGDAAHVHSPTGGQGVNLGLMDAVNLGWKLASVVRGDASHRLLDTYTAERHPVGAGVLHNTRAQAALLPPGPFVDPLRDIISDLMDLPEVKIYFGRMMTGIGIRYELPYAPSVERGLLGMHMPDLIADERTLYTLARDGRPLLLYTDWEPAVAEVAAPWGDRVHVVSAAILSRSDMTAVLVRPDGVAAWIAVPRVPGDLELLRTALRTWVGPEPESENQGHGVTGMEIMEAVDRAAVIAAEIVGSISEDQLSLSTPCSEWTVRDVLNHLLLGDLLCIAWIRGEKPPDRDVDHLGADPKASVLQGLADTRAELCAPGALARTVSTRMGEMPVAKLTERRIADLVAHLWDLAVATGRSTGYDPELVDFVEAHYRERLEGKPREGAPIAEVQQVSLDASAADRLAGYLGRTVTVSR